MRPRGKKQKERRRTTSKDRRRRVDPSAHGTLRQTCVQAWRESHPRQQSTRGACPRNSKTKVMKDEIERRNEEGTRHPLGSSDRTIHVSKDVDRDRSRTERGDGSSGIKRGTGGRADTTSGHPVIKDRLPTASGSERRGARGGESDAQPVELSQRYKRRERGKERWRRKRDEC